VVKFEFSSILRVGAGLTFLDSSSYSNKSFVFYIFELAQFFRIPVEFLKTYSVGFDAGKIQMSREGVVTASISVPCRYIHSPVSVMSQKDFESCKDIVISVLKDLGKNEYLLPHLAMK
jgi:endoglucanase